MEAEISVGQASDASWLDECAGKYFVVKGMVDYLNAETLTFGNAMRHLSNPDGHGTYFDTEEAAEACLARYWERQQEKRELKPIAYECDGSIEIHLSQSSCDIDFWYICDESASNKEYWTGDLWAGSHPKRFATPEEAYVEWETKIKGKE